MLENLPLAVVDTCVVSYIYDQDPRARDYERLLEGRRAVISFQTLEEVWFGAFKNGWGERRRRELTRYIDRYQVIWPQAALVTVSAELRSEREKAGRRLSVSDAWIAATAIMLGCPLVSHDRDFSGIPGLVLIQGP